ISITGNHYVQTIYNPHDSGADIDEIVLEIPLPYATVASINFTGTNITTGAQILDFQPGAIAANVKKVFYLTLSAPIKPGETGVIYLRSLSNPAVANNATNQFFLFTKNTVSGGICLAADMPGFPGAQTITNIAALPTVELYASVTPGFNLAAGTLGWPTAGYSNNSLHFQIVGNRVWSTTWTNRTSNENFDFSSAGVGFEATNAAGASNVFISNNCFWFKMHLVSVAGHSKYVTITNVVNAATAGSYQFYSAYSNNFTRTCAQTNEYNSTIRIVDHLFNATPAAGIFLSGGSNAPASRGYYTLVLHNPTNSGDAVDKIVFTLPAGFTAESVSAADAWFSYSAASLSSVTASGQTITAYFNAANPLGEGGTIFLPVRVSHPASAGAYAMSVTCSGLRDVYNLSCSYSLPAEISGYFDASQYIQVPAGMYADVNNYISASIGGSVKSGDQKCVVTFQTNGLSGTSIVSVVEKDVALPAYIRRVSKIYDINSSAALTKPATIKIIFTRPEAVEKLAQKFTLAYYESVSQKWVTVPTTIDMANTNASAQTMHFSPWALIEDRASLSNAVIDNLFAYPNPFSGETKAKISFSLGQASKIYLSIYDQHNRRVINLANGEPYEASFQEFTWNGKNAYGKDLPNGIYFINLKVEPSGEGYENTVKTAKLILSR
ncbi:MAG TPA: hypothetical protein DC049_03285, partial [Spirochaetia bacterium]|nr:hypothetical protein [Spirochaetia bacterium]